MTQWSRASSPTTTRPPTLNISKIKEMVVDFRKRQQWNYPTTPDLWDSCDESEQLQVPWSTHLWGSDLDSSQPSLGEQSQTTLVPSETVEGSPQWSWKCSILGLRKVYCSVHLCVGRKLLNSGLQSPAESGALNWAHLRVCTPLSGIQLHQVMQDKSTKSSRTPPTLVTVCSACCNQALSLSDG